MPIHCICAVCEVAFSVKPSALKRGAGKTCSRRCKGIAQSRQAPVPLSMRFWSHVERSPRCWLWTGRCLASGYGALSIAQPRQTLSAHRVSWEIASGKPVPDEFDVLHDCPDGDNPPCVRNDPPGWKEINGITRPKLGHLWLGTHADNMADMANKGRQEFGERHHAARLTDASVADIRAAYAAGGVSQSALAREYDVHLMTINQIILRRTWRHVL